MRHAGIAVLTTMLLLLCACSGSGKDGDLQSAIDFRADYLGAASCSYTAEVTADYGETIYAFTMDCISKPDGTTELTVTEPESIAGITAQVTGDNGEITFDGMSLDFGTLAEGNVIPVAAPAVTADCWREAYIASAGREDGKYRVSYERGYEHETLQVDTWFSTEKNIPIYAEICYNDICVLKVTITGFQFRS